MLSTKSSSSARKGRVQSTDMESSGFSTMAKILVVDDQSCVRELLSLELTLAGYVVAGAADARSAKKRLLASRPDLVVLDLYLDEPDGFELLEDIKRQDPDMPVIIFTAYDTFRDDPRMSKADGYVVKSLDFAELKQRIAEGLSLTRSSQPQANLKTEIPQFSMA